MSFKWRIKEDVPVNLLAVKLAAEKVPFPNEVLGDDDGGGLLKEKRIQKSTWAAGELSFAYFVRSIRNVPVNL